MSEIPRYRMTNSFGHQDNVKGGWVMYEDHIAFAEDKEQAVSVAVLAENIRIGGIVEQINEIADAVTPPTTCGCPGGYVKEATAPEPKFKVGDEVTIINPFSYLHRMTGKITSIIPSGSGPVHHNVFLTVAMQEATIQQRHLIHRVPITCEPKFKVGDRVVGDNDKQGTVRASYFLADSWSYVVDWDSKSSTYYGEESLTLYVPPTPAELIPTLKEHEWVQGVAGGREFGPATLHIHEHKYAYAGMTFISGITDGVPNQINNLITSIERCEAPGVN